MNSASRSPRKPADPRLAAVLNCEKFLFRLAECLGASAAIFQQKRFPRLEHVQSQRQLDVPQILKARQRIQPVSPSRVAGDENQVPLLRSRRAPSQVMLDFRRLAVLIRPEKANVEVVTRILEVVGVAAEERDVELWSEDQPNVCILLVCVEVVLAALIESDDLVAVAVLVGRFFLDCRGGLAASLARFRVVQPRGPLLTRSVTSSIAIRTLSSRSGAFASSS